MSLKMFNKIEDIIGSLFHKEYSLFTANGTTAIWLALKALGIQQKKVVMPANICFVVPCAVVLSGNEPVFVDIDDKFSIDPELLKGLGTGVGAVIFPHMYGNVGSIEKAVEVAKQKKWAVIEDVAQALGANKEGKYAGSFADISIASFGMGKIIDANAGGILSVNSKSLYIKAAGIYQALPVNDQNKWEAYLRFNQLYCQLVECLGKGDDLHEFGAILAQAYSGANLGRMIPQRRFISRLEKELDHLADAIRIREENAAYFQEMFSSRWVTPVKHGQGSVYWRQNILVRIDRDGLAMYLKAHGVKASRYFPSIDRLFRQRKSLKYENSDLMAEQIINLWPGKETSFNEIKRVDRLIVDYYHKKPIRGKKAHAF